MACKPIDLAHKVIFDTQALGLSTDNAEAGHD